MSLRLISSAGRRPRGFSEPVISRNWAGNTADAETNATTSCKTTSRVSSCAVLPSIASCSAGSARDTSSCSSAISDTVTDQRASERARLACRARRSKCISQLSFAGEISQSRPSSCSSMLGTPASQPSHNCNSKAPSAQTGSGCAEINSCAAARSVACVAT